MRSLGRWILFAATILTSVALAVGAYLLAGTSWDAVVDYRSPVADVYTRAAGSAESAASSRTVLVIIDGLTLEASREMGTLQGLRASGADITLTAPQPSLSYPNWTTILSGARPEVSGVVTNWHEGAAPVETIFDTAKRQGIGTVFVGPEDFETLYGVQGKTTASYMEKWDEKYLSDTYVDQAIRLTEQNTPRLLVVHLPDIDEAGHGHGAASAQYSQTVAKVDGDLRRLVEGLQDGKTTFVIVADHGHLESGGHGGWERDVVTVPAVFAGPGVTIGSGEARQEDIAASVALLAGIPVPRSSLGVALPVASLSATGSDVASADEQRREAARVYVGAIVRDMPQDRQLAYLAMTEKPGADTSKTVEETRRARLDYDRSTRVLDLGPGLILACVLTLIVIGVVAWRPFVAAMTGALVAYGVYNLLFFVVHGYRWSLSAFNSEDMIGSWMNGRMLEAAIAGLIGAAVAGAVYPFLRRFPRAASGQYLAGWLTLGPLTMLVTQLTLGIQAGWYLWSWGLYPTWRLPDLMWAFKYDLDLVQATALGVAAILAPLVTYLVGRYHPKVRRTRPGTAQ